MKEKQLVRADFAKIRDELREKMERTKFGEMGNMVYVQKQKQIQEWV